MINSNDKPYISKKNAHIYYDELLKNYQYDTKYLYIKVPCLHSLMEYEILREVTGIKHLKPFKTGQLKWLTDREENRDNNGVIRGGFIPKEIIQGIKTLCAERNVATHKQDTDDATYRFLFRTIAKTINKFSRIPIPKEIIAIYDGKVQQTVETEKKESDTKAVKPGYWFVNTGIGKDTLGIRSWKYNLNFSFVNAGDGSPYLANIRKLKGGDKIFAYISGKGYVGFGEVEKEAVPVKEYFKKYQMIIHGKNTQMLMS
jgi:hypothetical protein